MENQRVPLDEWKRADDAIWEWYKKVRQGEASSKDCEKEA
jgi:hypothetical protein